MLDALFIAIIAYLVGSFPTAIIAGKWLRKIDIRDYGSGNAGATNVLRTLGWKAALIVLLIDMFKGFVPVFWFAALIHGTNDTLIYYQILAAICAIAGHIWTIFGGFRGGKGVGTAAGVFAGLAPLPLLSALAVFIIVVSLTRYVSLGSISGAVTLLLVISYQKFIALSPVPDILYYLSVVVVLLLMYAHRENVGRLLQGTENKISFKNKDK